MARRNDEEQAIALERWLHNIIRMFGERILPVNAEIADVWGRPAPSGDSERCMSAK